MNKSIILFAAISAIFTFSSCTKCNECSDCPLGIEDTICRDGYDSNSDYQNAVDEAENAGCNCSETVK